MKSDLRILGYLGVCEWHAGSVWTANHQSQPLFIRLSNKAEPALKNKMRTSTKLLTSFFIHTSPFKHSYSSYLEKSPAVFSNIVQLSKKRSVTDCVQLWKLVEQTGSDIMNQEFISDMKSAKHFFFLLNYNNLWILGEPPSFTVCTDGLQQVRQGVFSQLQSATLPLAVTKSHTLDRKQQHQPPRSNDKLLQR